MKKIFSLFIIFSCIVFCFTGCFNNEVDDNNNDINGTISAWRDVLGSYIREDSSQFNNASLNLKYLSDDAVMFEFKLMEGSESEEEAIDTEISGVMETNENKGVYEINDKSINFEMSDDKKIRVTHLGEFMISPDGVYEFGNEGIELSDELVAPILNYLPEELTGLNKEIKYTINASDGLVNNWFYPVDVTLDETEDILAKFIIAKDLSAIYRVDSVPTLIYGSAKNMMEAQTYVIDEFEEDFEASDEEEARPTFDDQLPVVMAMSERGTLLEVGDESKLIADLPWDLDYMISATSADSEIVSVEGNVLKAVSEGETNISGKIVIDDAEKEFHLNIFVVNDIDEIFE